ncbi:MAG TPA: caspase family protein [Polyangium sp.]|nr:caspase family protein [Polyangium sp.]
MVRRQTLAFLLSLTSPFVSAQPTYAANPAPTTATLVPQLVRTNDTHHAGILSPNGRLAASVHRGLVHLWDVDSGALLLVNPANGAQPILAFSSDGQQLRFVNITPSGFFISNWNVTTNETTQHKVEDNVIALAAGGTRALIRDWKHGGVLLYDIDNDKPIRAFAAHPAPRPSLMTHDPHQVAGIVVSARGDVLLLERWDGACEVWDIERGAVRFKEEHKQRPRDIAMAADGSRAAFVRPAEKPGSEELVLLDAQAGKILRTMPIPSGVQKIALSPKGRQAWLARNGYVHVWDLETAKELRKEPMPTNDARTLVFIDEQRVLVGSSGNFEIRNATDTKKIHSFTDDKPALAAPNAVSFTRMAQEMLVIDREGDKMNVRHWESARFGLQRSSAVRESGDMARLTADNLRIWSKNGVMSLSTWPLSGGERREFKSDWSTFQLQISPVLPLSNDHAVIGAKRLRVDSTTQKPIAEYVIADLDAATGGKTDRLVEPWPEHAEQLLLAVSNDGKFAAAQIFDTQTRIADMKLWSLQSGKLERVIKLDSLVWPVATFLGPERIAVAYRGNSTGQQLVVSAFDVRTGASVWTTRIGDSVTQTMQVSLDGTWLGVAGTNVSVLDAKTGSVRGVWPGDSEVIEAIAFSPDNRHLLAGGRSGVTTLHRLDERASVHMIASADDWLIYSDDGYFDASRKGGRLLAAVNDLQAYRIDQLAVRNNRPDILLTRLGIGTPEMVAHYRARYNRRLDKLGIRSESALPTFAMTPQVTLQNVDVQGNAAVVRFEAVARNADLLRYNVFVNDVPLFGPTGKPTSGRTQRIEERIELGSGPNKIEVTALDAAGAESLRAVRSVDHGAVVKGDLYYVAFGVSRYKNPKYNLGYPHKDVLDLGEVLRAGAGKTFRHVHVRTHVDQEATVENIRRAKDFLKDAGVEDTVILFIAGHGLHSRDAAADYYFATHEIDPKQLATTAARFEVVEDLLMGIRARKKLFLMDTCESGEREENDAPSGGIPGASRALVPRPTRALELDLAATQSAPGSATPKALVFDRERYIYNDLLRRTGAIVISSSRGSEFSFELPEIENGVFTEEMLRALTSDVADRNHDGIVSTDELRTHLSQAVPGRTDDQQHPTVDRDNLEVSFGFPVAQDAAAIVDRPASALPQNTSPEIVAPPTTRNMTTTPAPARCGCELPGARHSSSGFLATALLALVIRWRRRPSASMSARTTRAS